MVNVRKCFNENCECNVDGVYCEASEIVIDHYGMCGAYYPKSEEQDDDN
jgi:hypothetical protein